jgi:hypothetical protein
MTLKSYRFHKNSLEKSQGDKKETIDITCWDAKELDKAEKDSPFDKIRITKGEK